MTDKSFNLFSNCPWESKSNSYLVSKIKEGVPGQRVDSKAVPSFIGIGEESRGGISKAYIPKFLYKPPFGYPRFVDIPNIRRLAATPYVEMCISTIIDEMCSIKGEVLPIEGKETDATEKHIEEAEAFFKNPNTNKESWEEVRRKYLRDILEIDAGVLVKMFNAKEEMVEIVARDGGTFTKNPDIYGMFTDREDILYDSHIVDQTEPTHSNNAFDDLTVDPSRSKEARLMEPGWINAADAREKAAYFQYGWISGARPVPFGKRELVWFEKNSRTDNIYGRSAVENLADTIQTLVYAIEHNLSYFNDNTIPPGVLGFEGSDADELDAFREQWEGQQMVQDSAGKWKKKFHNLPIVGKTPKFERFSLTNAELELLEGQKWWAKLVWACFGVTSVELGYTEDSKGLANQIVQSNVFKKRSINPLLRLEEYRINNEIISEFDFDDIEYKYPQFDVEEETKKAALYQQQITAGWKSINEIRLAEGLDEVEWGEKQSMEEQLEMQSKFDSGSESSMGSGSEGSMKKEENDQKKKVKTDKERLQKKGYSDNPLILRENEEPTESKLKKGIIYLLRQNETKIKSLIEKEAGTDTIKEIKALPDLVKAINSLLSFVGIKTVSDAVIKGNFMVGVDGAEKQLNRNLLVNTPALEFIQDYTFNNIKGMTEEISADLRQELERGIMEGDSVSKLKARVSKVFDVGENRAEMIARTESNRAENQGKLQAFKSSDEKLKKEWLTHEDDRTSPICKRLDGQVVGLNENFKDKISGWEGPCPPSHVSCRSTVLYIEDK